MSVFAQRRLGLLERANCLLGLSRDSEDSGQEKVGDDPPFGTGCVEDRCGF
jgi:hypothetical protein